MLCELRSCLTVVLLKITDIVLHMYVFVKLTHIQKFSLLRVEDDFKLMLQIKYYFMFYDLR